LFGSGHATHAPGASLAEIMGLDQCGAGPESMRLSGRSVVTSMVATRAPLAHDRLA